MPDRLSNSCRNAREVTHHVDRNFRHAREIVVALKLRGTISRLQF
jgi:hypothetical protein